MQLKTFDEFISEKQNLSKYTRNIQYLSESFVLNSGELTNKEIHFVEKLNRSSKKVYRKLDGIMIDDTLTENVVQKSLDKLLQSKEFKDIKDSVANKLKKAAESFKKFKNFIKEQFDELKKLFSFDRKTMLKIAGVNIKNATKKVKEKIESVGDEDMKEKRKIIVEEVKNAKDEVFHVGKKFKGDIDKTFKNKIEPGLKDAFEDEKENKSNESLNKSLKEKFIHIINEGNWNELVTEIKSDKEQLIKEGGGSHSWIGKVVHDISAKVPPFSWLADLANFYGKNLEKGMNKASEFIANKLDGPGPFKFHYFPKIVSYIAEMGTKKALKKAIIIPLMELIIPGYTFIVSFLSYAAYIITSFEIIENLGWIK
jgi:hypothetical protein